MKRLNLLGLGIGIGLLVGVALPILYILLIIYNIRKSAELAKTGTRVTATVTRVITHNVKSFNFNSENFTYEGQTPKKVYSLVARWQNPQTGKTYTLRSPVRNAEQFSVGSSVSFLIDTQHPKRHLLDTRRMQMNETPNTTNFRFHKGHIFWKSIRIRIRILTLVVARRVVWSMTGASPHRR